MEKVVVYMLEELLKAGVDLLEFKVAPMDISKGNQLSKAFTANNPNQSIP